MTLPGNLQTPGTMVVELDFRQPKKSNSRRKGERLSADKRRKAADKLQDENKNLKRKTERLCKQLQRKKKKNSTIFSRTHLYLLHLHRDQPPNPLHSKIKVKKHLVPKPYGITLKPDTVRDDVMVLAAHPNDLLMKLSNKKK